MHGTIKNNYNYTHTWVQIIHSVRVTHFLSHTYTHEFYSFVIIIIVYKWVYFSFFIIGFLIVWFIYISFFVFCTTLIHLARTKIKKT